MKTSMYVNNCYNFVTKLQSSIRRAATFLVDAVPFMRALMLALAFLISASHLKADSVTVTITVDNGYGFGFGDQNGIYAGQYYGGVDNCQASQIFGSPCYVFVPPDNPIANTDTGAEIYNITAGANDYIYIVAWSDDDSLQGAVASFTDNNTSATVTTSPAWPWQVFATGTNWHPNCASAGTHGPPLTGFPYAINNQISVANAIAGGPGTSVTWVNNTGGPNGRLDFSGQFNGNTYTYPVPACIAPGALWMEYNPEPANPACNPFAWGSVPDYFSTPNFLREYLIYRIGPLGQILGGDCLQVQCPTNKTVECGSGWTFDQPTFWSCCTNQFNTGVPGGGTNVMIVSTGIVTNGACPQMAVTQNWTITDSCGNSTNCSQTVTVLGCCADCLQVQCPTNKTVDCTNAWTFDQPTASSCCTNLFDTGVAGSGTNVLIVSTGIVTNGDCPRYITQTWVISDGCGDTNTCSQTVIVTGCCTNCLQVQCPTNKTVIDGSGWTFDLPSVYTCCTTNMSTSTGVLTNVIITPIGTVTNGTCPQYVVTQTWQITDACGNSTNCSQTVTVDCTTNCCAGCTAPYPYSYSVTVYPGLNYLADNLCQGDSNTVDNVLSDVPDGTQLYLLNQTFTYYTGSGWLDASFNPATNTVVPGEGFEIDNTGTTAFTLVIQGCQPDCPLPCSPTNGWSLIGGYGTNISTWSNLFSCPPVCGTEFVTFDPVAQQFTTNIFINGTWTPSTPLLQVGQSAWVEINPNPGIVVTCPPNKTVQCSDTNWTFDLPSATTCCTNNIPGAVTNVSITPIGTVTNGTCPQVTITQSWLIEDGCGDTNICSQTVTVLGCCTNCLQVQCPTNKTVQCGSGWTFNPPSASSCCSGKVFITSTSIVTNGTCPKYITNNWIIHDNCGNTDTCSQVVTVVDTTPPVISCPTNVIIVSLNTNCQLVIPSIGVSATDNCTPLCSLVYSQSPTNGTIIPGTNAYVTVTVTDLCGNSSQCQVRVEGIPRQGLVVSWPTNIVVTNCLVPCASNYVHATDCSCPLTSMRFTQSPPCNTTIGPGINSITVTVTDCHGFTSTKVIPLIVLGDESFLYALTNTGISATGTLLPQSAIDPHYTLGPVPGAVPGYVAPRALVVTNQWSWLELVHVSQWIAPTIAGNNLLSCPSGYYTYTNKFTLPVGANPATASISGRWAADDGAVQLYLNGVPTGNTIPASYGFNHWTPFTINSGFITGQNTLLFVVTNAFVYSPGPTGLRVEYTNATVCAPCAPPNIIWITPAQSLSEFSTATFNVNAGGTPPFGYQWKFNGSTVAGATASTLQLHSIGFSAAGLYSVIITNPCGVVTGQVRLTVTQPLTWTNGWWNVSSLADPLAATFGSDLVLAGTNLVPDYAISAGTTEDFGLPNPGGQIVNVMDINPQAGATIQVPAIAASGSTSADSYTVIMDIYEPDTSLGTPSTLFQSISCCVSNLGSGGQDGVALTLDAANNLHITGSAAGQAFDATSTTPLPVNAWNRVAFVVDNPQDGSSLTLDSYLNGVNVATLPYLCPCCTIPFTASSLNWTTSSPIILSAPANAASPNAEFYVSSIQFHAAALSPQMIAGIGSPDDGPAPGNETLAGPQPLLSATMANGVVNLTWSGSPYVLQETTDLNSDVWEDSALPFTESQGSGNILTTAVANPSTEGPSKFYRLVFRP